MSEKRLQEIKDSINLQYKVQEANDLHSFNIFTDEEQELVEEIERLHYIIKEAIEYIEEHFEKEYNKPKEELKKYNLKNCTYDTSLVVLDILKGSEQE